MCKFKQKDSRSYTFRPFEELKSLLESKSLKVADDSLYNSEKVEVKPDTECEENLFAEAMSDVKPISGKERIEKNPGVKYHSNSSEYNGNESEAMLKLDNLVKNGEGFVVADTSEYIEGTGYYVNPEIVKRLHQGDFSMQGYIDLHGLGVKDAQDVFENFFKEAVTTGKRAVLVIHGRGLSSPVKPVLKNRVQEWLTSGPLRKWVIAFSSARNCDGGTGATYVLLRERPFTKRFRKGRIK